MMTSYDALFSDWESRHYYLTQSDNADQVEMEAIKYGLATIESALNDEMISDSVDLDSSFSDHSIELELEVDNSTSDLKLELQRRIELLGDFYPFNLDGNNLVYTGSYSGVYEFCLAICRANLNDTINVELPRLFETLSGLIFKEYLGEGSSYVRTGWPNGKIFQAVYEEIFKLTGEWRWKPGVELPANPKPKSIKDGGVDFIVWRDVFDSRNGKLFFLGQCACGKNWSTKYNDVELKRLQQWFNYPMCQIEPVKVFSTPFHIVGVNIREVNIYAGMAIDRIRLSLYSEKVKSLSEEIIKNHGDSFKRYVESVLGGALLLNERTDL